MDLVQKRLVKFLLKRLIGPYLSAELNVDQLDVQLAAGELRLSSVGLNPEAFRNSGIPVAEGWIDECELKVPYTSILTKSCKLSLTGVYLTLQPPSENDQFEDEMSMFTAKQSSMLQSTMLPNHQPIDSQLKSSRTPRMARSLMIAQTFLEDETTAVASGELSTTVKPSAIHSLIQRPPGSGLISSIGGNSSSSSSNSNSSNSSGISSDRDEGMQMIAVLIDRIAQQINIRLNNVQIRVPVDRHYRGDSQQYYTIHVPTMEFSDIALFEGSLTAGTKVLRLPRGFMIDQPPLSAIPPGSFSFICQQECRMEFRAAAIDEENEDEEDNYTTQLLIGVEIPAIQIDGSFSAFMGFIKSTTAVFKQRKQQYSATESFDQLSQQQDTSWIVHIVSIIIGSTEHQLEFSMNNFRISGCNGGVEEGSLTFTVERFRLADSVAESSPHTIISAEPSCSDVVNCLNGCLAESELVLDFPCQLSLTLSAEDDDCILRLINAFNQLSPESSSTTATSVPSRQQSDDWRLSVNFDSILLNFSFANSPRLRITLNATRLLHDDPLQSIYTDSIAISLDGAADMIRAEGGLQLRHGGNDTSIDQRALPINAELRSLLGSRTTQLTIPRLLISVESTERFNHFISAISALYHQITVQSSLAGSSVEPAAGQAKAIIIQFNEIDWRDLCYQYQSDGPAALAITPDYTMFCLSQIEITPILPSPTASVALLGAKSTESDVNTGRPPVEAVERFMVRMEDSIITLHFAHLYFNYNRPPVDPLIDHLFQFYQFPSNSGDSASRKTADNSKKLLIKFTDCAIQFTAETLGTLRLTLNDAIISSSHTGTTAAAAAAIRYNALINQCSIDSCPPTGQPFVELVRLFDTQLECAIPCEGFPDSPPVSVEIDLNRILVDSCCDSLHSLVDLLTLFTDRLLAVNDAANEAGDAQESQNHQQPKRRQNDALVDTMSEIDENAFRLMTSNAFASQQLRQQNSTVVKPINVSHRLPVVENYFNRSEESFSVNAAAGTTDFSHLQLQTIERAALPDDGENDVDEDDAMWREAVHNYSPRHEGGFGRNQPVAKLVIHGESEDRLPVMEDYFPVSTFASFNFTAFPRRHDSCYSTTNANTSTINANTSTTNANTSSTNANSSSTNANSSSSLPQFTFNARCKELVWKLWAGFDWPVNQQTELLMSRQRRSKHSEHDHSADGDRINDLYESEIEIIVNDGNDESSVRFIEHRRVADPTITAKSESVDCKLPNANEDDCAQFSRNDRDSMRLIMQQASVSFSLYSPPEGDTKSRYHDYSKLQLTVREIEMFDDLSSSLWRKFLTSLKPLNDLQERRLLRETNSSMLSLDLTGVWPDAINQPRTIEYRLKLELLPLRFHIDQDALNFLLRYFSYQPPYSPLVVSPQTLDTEEEPTVSSRLVPVTYFQFCDIAGLDIQLDYKPKHVDYAALRQGHYLELLNFFHLDGAEIELKRLQMRGVHGWSRLLSAVMAEWLPHITNTQLPNLVNGLSPVRTLVKVGESMVDLIVLPVEQYRKDGRLTFGLRKGASRFFRGIGMEGAKIGANLAIVTQTVLESAAGGLLPGRGSNHNENRRQRESLTSKFADSPSNIREGLCSATSSLTSAVLDTIETIIAVPVNEEDVNGGEESGVLDGRRVLKAIPIAILKPMLGATEAVRHAMLGVQGSLEPGVRLHRDEKYKSKSRK